jgi:alpha-N-arabinofuranosidase
MYVPFQNATFIPVHLDAGTYTQGSTVLPRVDAIGAKDASGRLWLALANLDPNRSVQIEASLKGAAIRSVAGETLTAAEVDSVNSFEAPQTLAPKPMRAAVAGGKLVATLASKSISVISLQQ